MPSISSSHNDLPISLPAALRKVFAMPPPTRTFSDLFNKFEMTSNLVETFEPPTILDKELPLPMQNLYFQLHFEIKFCAS